MFMSSRNKGLISVHWRVCLKLSPNWRHQPRTGRSLPYLEEDKETHTGGWARMGRFTGFWWSPDEPNNWPCTCSIVWWEKAVSSGCWEQAVLQGCQFPEDHRFEEQARYVDAVAGWHEAADGSRIEQLKRCRLNYQMLNMTLHEWICHPLIHACTTLQLCFHWHQQVKDFDMNVDSVIFVLHCDFYLFQVHKTHTLIFGTLFCMGKFHYTT